jgi:hypothetical protein
VEGLVKRIDDAEAARERVPNVIDTGSTGGAVRRIRDAVRVMADMTTPVASVVLTSVIEDTKGDTDGWLQGVRNVAAVGAASEYDWVAVNVGKGGEMKSKETASAR